MDGNEIGEVEYFYPLTVYTIVMIYRASKEICTITIIYRAFKYS